MDGENQTNQNNNNGSNNEPGNNPSQIIDKGNNAMSGTNTMDGANNQEINLIELLKNPKIQAQYDKKVQGAIETAQANWQEKQDETKTEAERLAKMNETEKLQYKLDQQEKANQDIQKRLNARDLKDEAIKIATNADTAFDPEYLNLIDFENINAEQLSEKTKLLKSIQDRIVEKAINEFSKEPSPKNVSQDGEVTDLSKMTYEQIVEYLNKNPNTQI